MLNACHIETTDRSLGYMVLQGPAQMTSRRGMRVKCIPFLEYRRFSMAAFQVRSYPPSTRCITNSTLNFNWLNPVRLPDMQTYFSTHFQHEPLFGAATHYCVYSNALKTFLSSLPTGRVDRKHASNHGMRDPPRSA